MATQKQLNEAVQSWNLAYNNMVAAYHQMKVLADNTGDSNFSSVADAAPKYCMERYDNLRNQFRNAITNAQPTQ